MSLKRFAMKSKPKRNREELLQSINRDRQLLKDYFQDLAGRESQCNIPKKPKQRDSYDLFFESACISIKSLPPKLAAEAKSRISQIITEFELRAISEEEQKQQQQQLKIIEDTSSGIVYEFQPYT